MKKLIFLLIFLISCASEPILWQEVNFSEKHFWLENSNKGEKSQVFIRQGENFYHFIWLDMMKTPIARKFLRQCQNKNCAYFENDGFLPPNRKAEQIFLALLENIDKPEFEIQGIYKVKNASLSQ